MVEYEQPPTRVRYGVMGYLCTLAFILYIDRICIGQAAGAMKRDLRLTNSQMGDVFGAFMISYAIFEVITGHWGDRYGSRRVLTRIVLWWSAFTALTGCVWWFEPVGFGETVVQPASWEDPPSSGNLVTPEPFTQPRFVLFSSFYLLLLVRFLFGAGEAGALPNAARVISQWFPRGRRGPAQALISMSAQIGGAVSPPLAAALILTLGWRWAFAIFGSLGVLWAFFFSRWFRDDPAAHPRINEAELRYIVGSKIGTGETSDRKPHPSIPWGLAFTNPNIWLLGLINACSSFYSYMLFSWFPTYLKEGRGVDEMTSGRLASLPFLFGATGVMLGGFLGDWLTMRTGSRRWALSSLGTIGLVTAGLLVGSSVHVDVAWQAALFCAVGFFFSYIALAAWWAAMGDVGGRHLGAFFGLCNMIGLAGGLVSQVFLGRFADYMKDQGYIGRAQWDPAFSLYAAVLIAGGLCWLFINPRRPVVPADAADD